MGLNLSKGQSLDLSGVLNTAGVGLGWQANENPNGPIFDLDVSAVLLQANGKIYDENYLVFYNSGLTQDYPEGKRPYSGDGSVVGAVDEKTDELVELLSKLSEKTNYPLPTVGEGGAFFLASKEKLSSSLAKVIS